MAHTKLALLIVRVLPSWLASLAMAGVFLAAWYQPEWFGWDAMTGLRVLVFAEVLAVFGFLFMLAGREDKNDWVAIVYVAAMLCFIGITTVDLVVGLVLPLHLVTRVARLRPDHSSAGSVAWGLFGTSCLMAVCWLFVGLFPFPALGWTASLTPHDLWLGTPTLDGVKRLPFGLPAWGFLYFFLISLGDTWGIFVRFVERTANKTTLGAGQEAITTGTSHQQMSGSAAGSREAESGRSD